MSYGLGRGLNSLIPAKKIVQVFSKDDISQRGDRLLDIPIENIKPNPKQPRLDFSQDLSKDLSLSEERIRGLLFLIPVYLLAFLMVSNIRYPSFKHLNLRKRKPFGLLVVMVLAILVVGSLPQISLFLLLFSYVVSGPIRALIAPYKRKPKAGAEVAEEQA